jgi:HAD superfamily hydrolase (TIGR01509 family)
MIKAILFDFDGLILETEEPVFRAWQELYASYGLQLPYEDWSNQIGTRSSASDPLDDLEAQIGKPFADRQALEERLQQREMALIRLKTAQPGVQAYLDSAQRMGLKIGLASSSYRQWVTGHLKRLNLLNYFDSLRTADDVTKVKPDPALYRMVLSDLGIQPQEGFALEDSPHGVNSAKAAGLYCVAVPNVMTASMSFDQADLRLESLEDLPLEALIQRIGIHKPV